jgi:hypothetical protein
MQPHSEINSLAGDIPSLTHSFSKLKGLTLLAGPRVQVALVGSCRDVKGAGRAFSVPNLPLHLAWRPSWRPTVDLLASLQG